METLGEAFPKEQARLRELIKQYIEIGPAGTFGKMMIEDVLRRADKAAMEQNLPMMISIFKEMKECQ